MSGSRRIEGAAPFFLPDGVAIAVNSGKMARFALSRSEQAIVILRGTNRGSRRGMLPAANNIRR
jgi:hypothetical protein